MRCIEDNFIVVVVVIVNRDCFADRKGVSCSWDFGPNNKFMMFNRAIDPTMTLWYGSVAFNHICFEAFNDCTTIQIRVNTKDRKIAIMPCPSKDKDAISWLKPSQKQKSKKLDCGKFTQPLFQMWDWDKELHYRTVGKVVTSGGKVMILFDFSHPEAWKGLRLVNGIKE